jgi:lysozyme
MSKEGMIELAGHEGICLNKYKDSVGVWTIGVGATRTEIPDIGTWPQSKSITVEEAFDLMKKSIVKYEKGVRRGLKVDVPQHVFDALVSWCYNVGTGWVKKASVIKLLNKGVHYSDRRVYNALMMYKKPKEIIPRRKKEAILLTTGIYSNKGKALLFPVNSRGRPVYGQGKTIVVSQYL